MSLINPNKLVLHYRLRLWTILVSSVVMAFTALFLVIFEAWGAGVIVMFAAACPGIMAGQQLMATWGKETVEVLALLADGANSRAKKAKAVLDHRELACRLFADAPHRQLGMTRAERMTAARSAYDNVVYDHGIRCFDLDAATRGSLEQQTGSWDLILERP